MATSGRGVDAIEALAGTGKTYTAAALAAAYRDAGYRVVGAAPTSRAVRELKEQAVIPDSFTLTRLAGELEDHGGFAGERTVLVLDEAGPERIDDLEPLWKALHEHHLAVGPRLDYRKARSSEELWRLRREKDERWLGDPDGFVLLAEHNGKAVGYALVRLAGRHQTFATGERIAELSTLSLLPEARGQGIGSQLLDAVGRELAELGVEDMTIVGAAGNEAALHFYERRSFTRTSHVLLGPAVPGP